MLTGFLFGVPVGVALAGVLVWAWREVEVHVDDLTTLPPEQERALRAVLNEYPDAEATELGGRQ